MRITLSLLSSKTANDKLKTLDMFDLLGDNLFIFFLIYSKCTFYSVSLMSQASQFRAEVEGMEIRFYEEMRLTLEKDYYFIVVLFLLFLISPELFSFIFSTVFLKLFIVPLKILLLSTSRLFPFWSPHFFLLDCLWFYSSDFGLGVCDEKVWFL